MIISLVGYMGSGKSHISKVLSNKIKFKLIDLDRQISLKNKMTIPEIFEKRGEIYFRKQENEILKEVLSSSEDCILSVGGGTPAYFNNMEIINQHSESIFLRTSVTNLTERILKQKDKRPLVVNIAEEDLPEFIAKHLFERNIYYSQAKFTIDTDGKEPEQIVDEILTLI
ncbi:shikimate kinase [Kaistella sp. DKR-2]|uniref:shikimate kinase n=1 Tax=Kaistella soli TaxID=2849654 RepID=UPI001C25FB18|nr:shikimate kinase [Kaistella soli]MBU8882901.1 shikimate kinase [Kaistella soli]